MLAWALDGRGGRVHVGDLDARRREDRAPFRCPGCGEELVARLGRVRARHFAHRPGSGCPLTAPESALHQNAKERLLWLFREARAGARRVLLSVRCPRCRRPSPVDLAGTGDDAVLEGPVGARRADVLVLRGGRPALALEVRAAHALGGEKEDALAALGVAAVEVDAREEWESVERTVSRVACARSVGFPPCPACRIAARADAARTLGGEDAAIAELENYRARGLLGTVPGAVPDDRVEAAPDSPPPVPAPVPDDGAGAAGDPAERPLTAEEQDTLRRTFRCPACGASSLLVGSRLVRHQCGEAPPRAVAWRGYDGYLVTLRWWHRT
jgi:predicted RNA-binding Zn-ribbon protein involved in translation (DUF1610 family)